MRFLMKKKIFIWFHGLGFWERLLFVWFLLRVEGFENEGMCCVLGKNDNKYWVEDWLGLETHEDINLMVTHGLARGHLSCSFGD